MRLEISEIYEARKPHQLLGSGALIAYHQLLEVLFKNVYAACLISNVRQSFAWLYAAWVRCWHAPVEVALIKEAATERAQDTYVQYPWKPWLTVSTDMYYSTLLPQKDEYLLDVIHPKKTPISPAILCIKYIKKNHDIVCDILNFHVDCSTLAR